jgi:hypothetical protein
MLQSLLSRSLTSKAIPASMTPVGRPGQPFQLVNGRLVGYTDNPRTFIEKGYDINDIVYSIINLIMDKVRVAPWSVYKIVDEQAYTKLKGMANKKDWSAKDFAIAVTLQRKALELAPNPGKWGDLLKYPNADQTFNDFVADGVGYKLLTGNKYIWANVLKAGANAGTPNSLHLLPAQHVDIFAIDIFPPAVSKYQVRIWPNLDYLPKEILHEKYWNPNWDVNGQQLYGVAPLRAALSLLNRNNSSMTASAATFANEGIKGILSMDNPVQGGLSGEDVMPEVANLKETMLTEWVGEQNKGRMGISGYKLSWIPIGLTSEDMKVIESEKWDLRRLCNIFGIQSQLLNDPDNKTYANAEQAEKALTTRAALPALTATRDNLNRKAQSEWGLPKGMVIDFDMTIYSELAPDMGKMVGWLVQLMQQAGLPPNMALDYLQFPKIDDPYYDLPRVTTQMGQTREEHDFSAVDAALNEGDPNAEEDDASIS